MSYWWDWTPRPSAAQRRRDAIIETAKLTKRGKALSPVVLRGHKIASTFWGKSWCTNLERYSDAANRLPRGRSYLRSGSVVHLAVSAGGIDALVRGSELYEVKVTVAAVPTAHWADIRRDSAGTIDSLVELLQGRFAAATMERLCRAEGGLFPRRHDISFSCSCPDGVSMCKHVAAVLYGIGARLDAEPEILFHLRKVDENDLIAGVVEGVPATRAKRANGKTLEGADLSALFGLDLGGKPAAKTKRRASAVAPAPPAKKKAAKNAVKKAAKKSPVAPTRKAAPRMKPKPKRAPPRR